jgi:hypothetical protein
MIGAIPDATLLSVKVIIFVRFALLGLTLGTAA